MSAIVEIERAPRRSTAGRHENPNPAAGSLCWTIGGLFSATAAEVRLTPLVRTRATAASNRDGVLLAPRLGDRPKEDPMPW